MKSGRFKWLLCGGLVTLLAFVANLEVQAFPATDSALRILTNEVAPVSFWGRPFPYGYTWGPAYTFGYARHRRCPYRVVREDTPDGSIKRRVNLCR